MHYFITSHYFNHFNRMLYFFTICNFFDVVRVAHHFSCSVLFYYVSLRSQFRVVMSDTISAQKLCSVRVLFTLFVQEGSCLIVIFVCLRIVTSSLLSYHMSLRSVFRVVMSDTISVLKTMFDSSLPSVVCRRAHVNSVLGTHCCLFLWIVHF